MADPIPKPVGEWLEDNASLAALVQRCRMHERLLQAVRRRLPETLAAHCLACVLDGRGRLTLYATSPVWASRLRYHQPAILAALRPDFPVRRFQIRIALPDSVTPLPLPRARIPSPAVIAQLEQALPTLPDPTLQRSLGRLIETWRRRQRAMRQPDGKED